jgi:tetratricopeptide (TPR) repeat protein
MPGFQEGNILSEKIGLSYPVILLRARHYLQLAMKKPTDVSHQVASGLAIRRRKYEKAIAEAEKALALNPSGSGFNFNMGCVLVYAGRPREAINYFKRALELDPLRPGWPLFYMGVAHFTMGQFNEAVALIKRALTHEPKKVMKAILAASYAHLDRYQEARDALNDYLKVFSPQTPDLSTVVNAWAFKELKDLDRFAQGLVKAGLPGRASDYCKISKQNKLTGKEIRNLLFGRTMGGTFLGSQWSVSHDKEGKCTRSGYTGKSWIEGDTLFTQYEILHEDRKFGMEIYRNPGGTAETMNEYCYVCDFAVLPFSVAD